MDVRLQPMEMAHVGAVSEIENLSFPTPWPQQTFEFELLYNDLALYIVAVCEGQVVGYGGAWIVLNEAHITNVAVRPEYRGRRIGKALMQEIMRRARARGADCITLEVRPSNAVARELYTSLGFVEAGLRKQYYQDNNEDAIIMWRHGLAES